MIEETTVVEDAVQVDTTEIAEIFALARERFARGQNMRGLPKPSFLPSTGWYSKQPRRLVAGEVAWYLMYRWRLVESNKMDNFAFGRLN